MAKGTNEYVDEEDGRLYQTPERDADRDYDDWKIRQLEEEQASKGIDAIDWKLKGWDNSKIPDEPYESKSMQDWIAVLQGHDVPECEPNNRAYAEAVRFGIISNNHGGVAPPTLKGEYIYERDGDIDEFNARLKKESEDV